MQRLFKELTDWFPVSAPKLLWHTSTDSGYRAKSCDPELQTSKAMVSERNSKYDVSK